MSRFACILVLLLALSLPAYGQDKGDKKGKSKKSLDLKVFDQGRTVLFKAKGANFQYPNNSVLMLGFGYQDNAVITWRRVAVKKGAFSASIGPFRKIVLPGTYRLEVVFDLARQPLYLQEHFRSKLKLPPYYQAEIHRATVKYKSKKEQREEEITIGRMYKENATEVTKLLKELNAMFNWKDLDKRKKAPDLATWKATYRAFYRGNYLVKKKYDNWAKRYLHMPYYAPYRNLIRQISELHNLAMMYTQYYKLEKIADKKEKEKEMKKWEELCRRKRIGIQKQIYLVEEMAGKMIDPKKKDDDDE